MHDGVKARTRKNVSVFDHAKTELRPSESLTEFWRHHSGKHDSTENGIASKVVVSGAKS